MPFSQLAEKGLAEVLTFLVVVFSTINIAFTPAPHVEESPVSNITGTILLNTPSSLEELGFEGYRLGAVATLDLEVTSVDVSDCDTCTGVGLNGSLILTELYDEAGRLIRVEGSVSITHIMERSNDLVHREWLTIHWKGGDIRVNTSVEVIHDPPRWLPSISLPSSLVEVDDTLQSRTGPWFAASDDGDVVDIQGCLPLGFTCDSDSRPDISLRVHRGVVSSTTSTLPIVDACDLSNASVDADVQPAVMLMPFAPLFEVMGFDSFMIHLANGRWSIADECMVLNDSSGDEPVVVVN